MKLFIDTANIDEIREVNSWGVLDGVTTNPTLLARENKDFKTLVDEITREVKGPISLEAVSQSREEIVEEALELSRIAPNVVVKIPVCKEGLAATKVVSEKGVAVNMTLIFSANQALLAAKAGARYASPFLGRVDDIGNDGLNLLSEIVELYANYDFDTEIIAASIRHPQQVVAVALTGADIATIPYKTFEQMIRHPLTDKGMDLFLKDWEKVKSLAPIR
ncbi:transaldolase [Candidatus Hakubella thermalkaliphila]|uniref:Probable transaldolase n=2 Tax=Candidatus Hakubella thermalkaliphila TaxID=2754717 RepID=A0A6V8PIZ5_9ACTN|nr:fructose-6-phosphate aldolase [Candidatus Hakubella thermalkaliphila]MBT9169913.1 Transaldolase [Actinomycetota bacterium]GFP19226.1 transaldolase [Candidatus Hakubella thermalkaliphila]GFP24071.1 transaldolase [Candidatus Hakubella thermalkaliphila]GFP32207.1 transaldolase [Candidatus Hakubella thermalkaliphila]GFP34506.1 transaldolase [Candidatus Hakubella thermalkaliphila]